VLEDVEKEYLLKLIGNTVPHSISPGDDCSYSKA